MATLTAGTLISAGLVRANMKDSSTGVVPHPATGPAVAFDLLNAAISELYEILYEADSESHALTKTPFSSVATQPDYSLATIAGATFYHLRAVEYNNGQTWVDLDRVNFADRNSYGTGGTPRGYALEGDNLTIYPPPAGIYQMRIIFIPNPPIMTADTDTIDLKGPWREYIELHFAIQALEIEESDTTTFEIRLRGPQRDGTGGLTQRIRNASKKRDSAKPIAVVDVVGQDRNYVRGFWPYS